MAKKSAVDRVIEDLEARLRVLTNEYEGTRRGLEVAIRGLREQVKPRVRKPRAVPDAKASA